MRLPVRPASASPPSPSAPLTLPRRRPGRLAGAACLAWLALLARAVAVPAAPSPDRVGAEAAPSVVSAAPLSIDLDGLDPRSRQRVRWALREAVRRLARDDGCRALFDDLREPGVTALARSHVAASTAADVACRPGVAATTTVGGDRIVLCRDTVSRLDRYALATLVLHETLHLAGMSERPHDPEALAPAEISALVQRQCAS